MEDPVILLPAGMTYDRKQICESLLHHPNLDPSSGVRYDSKLQYCANVAVRQLLMETYGDKAYRRYDDSGFQPRYQDAWNTGKFVGRVTTRNNSVEACERLSPLLWGMNLSQINLKAALELVEMFPEEAVMVVLKAMFLVPDINSMTVESCVKDLGLARRAWDRALGLGLREQAITGNAWAQWAEGRRQFYREKNNIAAVEWTRKAADQGFAAAQCTLGVMYRKGWGVAESPSLALEWWRKAAMQGFAAAQYCLGVRYDEGDLGVEKNYRLAVVWNRATLLHWIGIVRRLPKAILGLNVISGGITKEVWEWPRATLLQWIGIVRRPPKAILRLNVILEGCIPKEMVWNRATLLQWIGTGRRPPKVILRLNVISERCITKEMVWNRATLMHWIGTGRRPPKVILRLNVISGGITKEAWE
jgi:hypothetical protein